MANHQITITVNGKQVDTLEDILPVQAGLRILFIAKTPAPVSVAAGHYFQGTQGTMFWNRLADYGILNVPYGEYQDDHLLANRCGLTDIVKVPRSFGNEPSDDEYRKGLQRILELIKFHRPKVVVFVYKRVLNNILKMAFQRNGKSTYGFNSDLDSLFDTKVFVFPMPGTPCTREMAQQSMTEFVSVLAE